MAHALIIIQALAQQPEVDGLKIDSALLASDGSATPLVASPGAAALPPSSGMQEITCFLPLWLSVLLFVTAIAALCLCGHFHVSLSDMCDDLINPITLCNERVNSKLLGYECALHAVGTACWIFAWSPIGMLIAIPTLLLRLSWRTQLKTDPTTIFTDRVQRQLRWRWSVMCAWHAVATFAGFFQCASLPSNRGPFVARGHARFAITSVARTQACRTWCQLPDAPCCAFGGDGRDNAPSSVQSALSDVYAPRDMMVDSKERCAAGRRGGVTCDTCAD